MTDVDASYALCRQVARQSAGNFYYSFWLLPRPKRRAMYALYAFLRQTDDLGDGPLGRLPRELSDMAPAGMALADRRRLLLDHWRRMLEEALAGRCRHALLPALVDTVRQFEIPLAYLQGVLDGVAMDLEPSGYERFADLEMYCERVAGVVGQACICIWGSTRPEAFEAARLSGIAFQLTNILRDLKEDADRGRIYLPREDLRRFGYAADDLCRGVWDERFRALLGFQIERAERFFRASDSLQDWLTPEGRRANGAMRETYEQLLRTIRRRQGELFERRLRVSRWRKMRIAAGFFLTPDAAPRAGHRSNAGAGR